ncbi:unnamed protein product, partial [Symbiodinium sp. CCMP2592]
MKRLAESDETAELLMISPPEDLVPCFVCKEILGKQIQVERVGQLLEHLSALVGTSNGKTTCMANFQSSSPDAVRPTKGHVHICMLNFLSERGYGFEVTVSDCVPFAQDILSGRCSQMLEIETLEGKDDDALKPRDKMFLGYGAGGAFVNSLMLGSLGLIALVCLTFSAKTKELPASVTEILSQVPVVCPTRGQGQTPQDRTVNALHKTLKASQYNRRLNLVMIASTLRRSLEARLAKISPDKDTDLASDSIMREIKAIIKAFNNKASFMPRSQIKARSEWALRHALSDKHMPEEVWHRVLQVSRSAYWNDHLLETRSFFVGLSASSPQTLRDVAHEEMEQLYKATTETSFYILQRIQSGKVPGCDLDKPIPTSLISSFVSRVCIVFSIARTVLDPISTDFGHKLLENFEAGRLSARLDDLATMPVKEDYNHKSDAAALVAKYVPLVDEMLTGKKQEEMAENAEAEKEKETAEQEAVQEAEEKLCLANLKHDWEIYEAWHCTSAVTMDEWRDSQQSWQKERHNILWKEAGRRLGFLATVDHLSKECYATRVPSQVRGLLSGEMADAAVLVVADLQGHVPHCDLERTLCDTMASIPEAAKLLLFTDMPPRRHKTEKTVQMPSSMQVDADEAEESDCEPEEQDGDHSLPAVRAEGNVRLTLPEKQTLLAEHRKVLSKQLSETFGDGVNKHFDLPFTLLFNMPLQGRLTMDGLLVQPIKGMSRLDGTCLASGGVGVLQRPDKVVKFSKEATRNMRKEQCGPTSVARNGVNEGQRLQKGPGICGHILRNLMISLVRHKVHKAGLIVVDLCCAQGDWLLAMVAEQMHIELPDRYDMDDDEVPLDGMPDIPMKYVGFDTREHAVGFASIRAQSEIYERLSASELGYAAPPVLQDDKPEPVWQNLVAEVNRQLKILKVKNKDGSLTVPAPKNFKLQRDSVLEALEVLQRE